VVGAKALFGPLRPHKEDRLRKVLVNTEAVYEAQWIELDMAVGSRPALTVRRRVEAQQELSMGACDSTWLGASGQFTFFDRQYAPSPDEFPGGRGQNVFVSLHLAVEFYRVELCVDCKKGCICR